MEGPQIPEEPILPHNVEDLEDDALKDLVINTLRENGFAHESVRNLLIQWSSRKERSIKTEEDRARVEIERSKLYLDAGYRDEAVQALEDARDISYGIGNPELDEELDNLWRDI